MRAYRWLDRTQPQPLLTATVLLYLSAALGVIDLEVFFFPIGTVLVLGELLIGLGIANQKKLAYWAGVVLAVLNVAYLIRYPSIGVLINLIFWVALVALLLHPQSRSYYKTWFR